VLPTRHKRSIIAALFLAGFASAAVPTGPNVGERLPDFRLTDQNGVTQTLRSVIGPKGAMIVFYRSADW
jgi:hypothetical protein